MAQKIYPFSQQAASQGHGRKRDRRVHFASCHEFREAASTQNQSLSAIVFLYKQVLDVELGDFGPMKRAKKPERLPTVLNKQEVGRVLAAMSGTYKLMAQLLYGSGLRLM